MQLMLTFYVLFFFFHYYHYILQVDLHYLSNMYYDKGICTDNILMLKFRVMSKFEKLFPFLDIYDPSNFQEDKQC